MRIVFNRELSTGTRRRRPYSQPWGMVTGSFFTKGWKQGFLGWTYIGEQWICQQCHFRCRAKGERDLEINREDTWFTFSGTKGRWGARGRRERATFRIKKEGGGEVAQDILPDSGKKNGLFWCGGGALSWHQHFCCESISRFWWVARCGEICLNRFGTNVFLVCSSLGLMTLAHSHKFSGKGTNPNM